MALHHMLRAAVQQQAAGPSDPYFYDVSLLLTGDGTNGAQNNTFLDSSTNNFTITRNGNTTQGTFSPYGNLWSNYFNGSSSLYPPNSVGDFLCTGSSSGITATFEAWVNLDSYFVGGTVYYYSSFFSKGSTYLNLGVRNGAVRFYWYDGSFKYIDSASTSDVPLNTWTHIAVTINGSTVKIYINGVLNTTSTAFTGVSSGGVGNQPRIGQDQGGYLTGYVSNFRLTNTVVYTSNFTPSTTPLTAVSGTSLLTCQSNRFIDNSSNNFTLTVNGTPSVQRFSPFNPTAPYSASTIGGSGYFDGSGDYLSNTTASAIDFGGSDYTVEYWAYLTGNSVQNYGQVIGVPSLTNSSIAFGFIYNNLIYATSQTFGYNTNVACPFNSWNHIAWVRTGTTLKMYLNGVLSSTQTVSSSYSDVGFAISSSAYPLNPGYIANLRVVKGSQVYTTNFTPPTAPLTAISGTSLLTNFTNAGIPDAAMMNDLETVGNAQVSTSVKKYGTGSLYFDGTGDYLVGKNGLDFSFGTGDFTVEAWVNFTSFASGYPQLIAGHTSFSPQFAFTSTTMYLWDAVVATISGSYTWSTGVWYHVAWTRQNGTVRMFVNGTSVYSGTYTQNLSAVDFDIGTYGAGQSNGMFNGYIDDLRITKGYARYTSNFTPPTAALPVY